MERRHLVLLALIWGLLAGGFFWSVKTVHTGMLAPAPVQPDSLVYFQYARAIADGHPYRFTADQTMSTGSTSHLYPLVLALLIRIGGVDGLVNLSFVFDTACYAISLLMVALIAWRLKPSAAPLAVLLAGLGGHLAFTTLSDCDMSMFVPIALAIFAAAIHRRMVTLAALLAVAAWTRPEGMVMSGLLLACSGVGWIANRAHRADFFRFGMAGAAGIGASLLVFLWNHHLTGAFGFQSVVHKGHFAQFPFGGALILTAEDFVHICNGMFWGLGSGLRAMLGIPVLGGLLCIIGFCRKPKESAELSLAHNWWIAVILAATGLISTSGWSEAVFDRYLGWISPFICIYAAIGVVAISDAMRNRAVLWSTAAGLAVMQAATMAYFFGVFCEMSSAVASTVVFARQAQELLPRNDRLCAIGGAGLAYYMPGHSMVNFHGIVSPAMSFRIRPEENVEKLKHEPGLRFDEWIIFESQAKEDWVTPLIGKSMLREMSCRQAGSSLCIYAANWSVFDGADLLPLRDDIRAAVANMKLTDQLDVGYAADESSHARSVFTRIPGVLIQPFAMTRSLGKTNVMEAGDAVIGSETFTVHTAPHRALRVVMRTASAASTSVACEDGQTISRDFQMESPLRLRIICNGPPQDIALPITTDSKKFDEIQFDIPADRITGDQTEITIGGDHIALAYWFYQ